MLRLALAVPLAVLVLAPARVEVRARGGGGFELRRDGRPYYVKGAVEPTGTIAKIREYGGNSVRTGASRKALDRAWALGLTALVDLPVRAERDGASYDDAAFVNRVERARVVS